ncbi:MAG: 1-(5-phosphoribosyl)-5-[(5-phosphoribosylamino)methylideneamino]imidazole-4-carboxamide isomerase [Syntrophomonadales bacterium]
MIIFPAVDIKDGRCVRLVQGKKEEVTVYGTDPAGMAREWERQGAQWVHVVDLDGAFSGVPCNREIIRAMVENLSIPFQLGGGIRDFETARGYLELGVSRVIIGTGALDNRQLVASLLEEFGSERIIVGIDARDGMVAVRGWEDVTTVTALEMAREMRALGVKRTIYTDISRDGVLQGPNIPAIRAMAEGTGLTVIASGGVSTIEDIVNLRGISGVEGAIVGKALYEGRLTLGDALKAAKD